MLGWPWLTTLGSHSFPGHLRDQYPRKEVELFTCDNGVEQIISCPDARWKEKQVQLQEVSEKQPEEIKMEIACGQMNRRKEFRGEISEQKEETFIS